MKLIWTEQTTNEVDDEAASSAFLLNHYMQSSKTVFRGLPLVMAKMGNNPNDSSPPLAGAIRSQMPLYPTLIISVTLI